jgi:hypothetical protein
VENFFKQALNVHGVHDVRQKDIQTAEPFIPEPSLVEVKIVIGKMKRYKSPGHISYWSMLMIFICWAIV